MANSSENVEVPQAERQQPPQHQAPPIDLVEMGTVSMNNVTGYLKTARNRKHKGGPAEGGHGTKRHRHLVTAADQKRLSEEDATQGNVKEDVKQVVFELSTTVVVEDDDGEDWDQVVIAPRATETAALLEMHKKEEGAKQESVKREPTVTGAGAADPNTASGASDFPTEPTDVREYHIAKNRSLKAQDFCKQLANLMAVMHRNSLWYRGAHHPAVVSSLHKVVGDKRMKQLVDSAEPLVASLRSHRDGSSRLAICANQRPAWVSASKDNVGTVSSRLCKIVVDWMTDTFVLDETQEGCAPPSARHPLQPDRWGPHGLSHDLLEQLQQDTTPGTKIALTSSLYFSLLFICILHHLTGGVLGGLLSPRLVVAFDLELLPEEQRLADEKRKADGIISLFGEDDAEAEGEDAADPEKPAIVTAALGCEEVQIVEETDATRGKRNRDNDGKISESKGNKKPKPTAKGTGFAWCEVWCPESSKFFSVNPCKGKTTVWGAPYVFAVAGNHMADVTCRYVSKWSDISAARLEYYRGVSKGYLWAHDIGAQPEVPEKRKKSKKKKVGDNVESQNQPRNTKDFRDALEEESPLPHHITDATDCVKRLMHDWNARQSMPQHLAELQLVRERKQLHALLYSDPVPTTFAALKKHPLYVSEADVGKFEAVWPKDKSTLVGVLKSKNVYKRSAIVPLMSKEGWLRHGKEVKADFVDVDPAKRIKPPASRPLAPEALLYGEWQTIQFKPADARRVAVVAETDESGTKETKKKKESFSRRKKEDAVPAPVVERWEVPTISSMGKPTYLLLGHPKPGQDLVHLRQSHIAKVARRINVDFGFACVGYERKAFRAEAKPRWVPRTEGIVVLQDDSAMLVQAFTEWKELQDEAERKKRKVRAMRWWRLFIQRRLAMNRLESKYLQPDPKK